jgi:hypothetical protein
VIFIKREKKYNIFKDTLPYFFTFYGNIYWYLKHEYLRKELDNFKTLFENTLSEVSTDFVMMFTDDAIIFDEILITDDIFKKIYSAPLDYSYRMLIGENIDGFPGNSKLIGDNYYWNHYDKQSGLHWSYPFTVDGTLYHRKSLLKVIKGILYHSPITLEGHIVKYCRIKKFFSVGISPCKSKVASITINRVSSITNNYSINISVDLLSKYYLGGYQIEFCLPSKISSTSLVPDQVYVYSESEKIILHSN